MANQEHRVRVIYDTKGAVKEVEKLESAVEDLGKGTRQIESVGSALDKLGSQLGGVGGHAGTAFRAFASLGTVGASIAGVGVSVAGLAASLISVRTLLRDVVADGKAFDAALGKNLRLQNTRVDIESATGDAEIGSSRRDLRGRISELADAKNASAQIKSLIGQETAARRASYEQSARAANAYYDEAQSLQQRLNKIADAKVTDTGSVGDILRESRRALQGNDYNRTESLIAAAKSKAQSTNDASGLQDAAAAERNYQRALESRYQAQKQGQAIQTQQANGEKAALARLGQFAAKQREVERSNATQTVNQRNESRELTTLAELNKLGDAAAKSRNEQAAALQQLNNAYKSSPGVKDAALGGAGRALAALFDPTHLKAFRDQFSEAESLGEKITKSLSIDSSAQNIRKLQPEIAKLGELIKGVESPEGGQPWGFTTGIDRLQRMEDALQKLGAGAAEQIKSGPSVMEQFQQLGATADPLATTFKSSQGIATSLASAVGSMKELTQLAFGAPSSGAEARAAVSRETSVTTAVAAASGPTNATFNVQVTGGMVDRSTAQQIAQMIQREIRLGAA